MPSPKRAIKASDEYEIMNELCIMEDDIPRDGGRLPEYAATLFICVDKVLLNGIASGQIFSCCRNAPTRFTDLGDLLLKLDDLLDEMGTPERWCELRTLRQGKNKKRGTLCHRPSDFEQIQGQIATAAIRIYMRMNASMQGVLRLFGTSEEVAFRSALELLHLLREWVDAEHKKHQGKVHKVSVMPLYRANN